MSESVTLVDTVDYVEELEELVIIDQTQLPGKLEQLTLTEPKEIYWAIKDLQVRGAPAIGVAAAIGLYVIACRFESRKREDFLRELEEQKEYLASARPTAVNLSWALERMMKRAEEETDPDVEVILEHLKEEALAIRDEDIACCRKIAQAGLEVLEDGWGILTHCNAGQLATVRYGTALGPIHLGKEQGKNFHVYCDETRPLLQGARLSTYELMADGVDTTVLCDNMASRLIKEGKVNAVLVGADRIAANGDVCNKIGTSGLAILAKHYGIPFYVLAPLSTVDFQLATGQEIPIEERAAEEVTQLWYEKPMAPEGVKVYNPAFDVTDHDLVTGLITEYGLMKTPNPEAMRALQEQAREAGEAKE